MQSLKSLIRQLLPQPVVNYCYHLPKALLATYFYGNPARKIDVIAVTGTDGKTTTTTLLYHILRTARKKSALITTVEARFGRKSLPTGLHVTSPDPFKLQKIIRFIKNKKIRYLCLEVTSHGIDQFRIFPIKPTLAILTNVTHEHLDYHKTFSHYLQTKLRLLNQAQYAVINKDLSTWDEIKKKLRTPYSTYSIDSPSQLQPSKIIFLKTKTKFTLGNLDYELPLVGKYNLYNALAAISAALYLGVSPYQIRRALKTFKGVKGRMDIIKTKNRVVVIDFAHTPNALKQALTTLQQIKPSSAKLIAVFGAAGLRDKSKRPLMGKIASHLADLVVLTAEDPRTEDVHNIIDDIRSGIPQDSLSKVYIQPDRQQAITYALHQLAGPGDWVGVFGKGHEKSLCFGTKEYPWSDYQAVQQALQTLPSRRSQ